MREALDNGEVQEFGTNEGVEIYLDVDLPALTLYFKLALA
jgi:hypothetical protein